MWYWKCTQLAVNVKHVSYTHCMTSVGEKANFVGNVYKNKCSFCELSQGLCVYSTLARHLLWFLLLDKLSGIILIQKERTRSTWLLEVYEKECYIRL